VFLGPIVDGAGRVSRRRHGLTATYDDWTLVVAAADTTVVDNSAPSVTHDAAFTNLCT
jgi:hypothetical protein